MIYSYCSRIILVLYKLLLGDDSSSPQSQSLTYIPMNKRELEEKRKDCNSNNSSSSSSDSSSTAPAYVPTSKESNISFKTSKTSSTNKLEASKISSKASSSKRPLEIDSETHPSKKARPSSGPKVLALKDSHPTPPPPSSQTSDIHAPPVPPKQIIASSDPSASSLAALDSKPVVKHPKSLGELKKTLEEAKKSSPSNERGNPQEREKPPAPSQGKKPGSEALSETIVRPAVIEHLNPLFKKGAFGNKDLFKSYARALTLFLVDHLNKTEAERGGGEGGEDSNDEQAKMKRIVVDVIRRGLKKFCERRLVVRAESDVDLSIFKIA